MKSSLVLASIAAVAVAAGITLVTWPSAKDLSWSAIAAAAEQTMPSNQITIWRDPSCGCCDIYAEYLEGHGYQVTRVDDPDFDRRSIEAGVPEQGLGCHLAEIEGYYVSGLVPAEIIERLLTERPGISGITLPGMPVNAPGMALEKTGRLKVYAFGEGGVTVYSDE